MSFSADIKNEILDIKDVGRHCAIGELSALFDNNFKIGIRDDFFIYFSSENQFFSQRVEFLVRKFFDIDFRVKIRKNNNSRKNYTYFGVAFKAQELLKAINFLDNNNVFHSKKTSLEKFILKNNCCKGAYLRGEFVISGSISNPSKNYHLEFLKNNPDDAKHLAKILNLFSLNAKIVERKGYHVVYVKEGDKISDFLKLIGTYSALLNLESLMVEKDVRNVINRKQNCEMANLNKTIKASVKQVSDIEYIIELKGISYLSDDLQNIAKIRLEGFDLTLSEIGGLMNPVLSKSSVNYKLKKISEIAENLRRD